MQYFSISENFVESYTKIEFITVTNIVNAPNTEGKILLIQEEGIVVSVTVVETADLEDGIKPNYQGGSFI